MTIVHVWACFEADLVVFLGFMAKLEHSGWVNAQCRSHSKQFLFNQKSLKRQSKAHMGCSLVFTSQKGSKGELGVSAGNSLEGRTQLQSSHAFPINIFTHKCTLGKVPYNMIQL